MLEEWRKINNFDSYLISNLGIVKNIQNRYLNGELMRSISLDLELPIAVVSAIICYIE